MGKVLAFSILITAAVAGAVMYYLQVYAFYDKVPANGVDDVVMTSLITDTAEPVLYGDFRAIDADSSPIRYRACFTTKMSQAMLTETYHLYEKAEPLTAPGWFDCFDAVEIGEALEEGRALAFLGTKDVRYGIDRVVAIHQDGRGFVWHQINRCGEIVFDGAAAPDDCPKPPEGYK